MLTSTEKVAVRRPSMHLPKTPTKGPPPPTLLTPPDSLAASAGAATPPPPVALNSRFPLLQTSSTSPQSVRHARCSAQKEPGSDNYLARVFSLARSQVVVSSTPTPHAASGPSPTAMADFLAGFSLGAEKPTPSSNGQCKSVEELVEDLKDTLQQKTTETRSEHCAVNLELRNTVKFNLSLSETENEALEGVGSLETSTEGGGYASTYLDPAGGSARRVVTARETLMKQSENPVVQRTVAKHILGAISAIDGSTWNLRDLSRGSKGWTFTYICRDSLQQWVRQNAKNPDKPIIGEFSKREPEPTLMSRPAFDCRGSITIAFNRSTQSVVVKYDHTLIHQTVGQLSQRYPPPSREFGPGFQRQQQQKTPKKSQGGKKAKEPKEPKEPKAPKPPKEKAPRKKRPNEEALDENGERPKKRKRKSKPKDSGPVMPPDYPGAPQEGSSQQPSYADAGPNSNQDSGNYPAGLVGGGASGQSNAVTTGALPFNVAPEEAARRIAIAKKLLSDAGVNPDTLSADQMTIFANQSPDLQKDSVAMLAKYGAERLQIIHPGNKDKLGSESSTSASTAQATPAGPMTTKELAPDPQAKGKQKKTTAAAGASTTPQKKMGKSRVACKSCKSRKVKCPKERPACSECEGLGQGCEYPPQRPRKSRAKTVVTIEDDGPDEDEEVEEEEEQGEEQQEDEDETEVLDPSLQQQQQSLPQDMSYSQMPVADMLTPNIPETNHQGNFFQSASGLILPTVNMTQAHQEAMSNASGLALPAGQSSAAPEVHMSSLSQPPAPQAAPPKASPKQRKSRAQGSRRSLPQGSSRDGQQVNPASSWAAANVPPPTVTPAPPARSAMKGQQRSQNTSKRMSTNSPQLQNSTMQPAQPVQAQVPVQQQGSQAQQSPNMVATMQAQARASPLQARGQQRTNSRQSQRAQSRTPNTGGFNPPAQNQTANQGNNLVASTTYNNYNRYVGDTTASNEESGGRIAYEPYSQQQQTSTAAAPSYPAFDYRQGASTSMAPSDNTRASTANQWSGSQTRSSQSYDKGGAFGSSSCNQPAPVSGSASLHNFDMRGSAEKQARPTAGNKQQQDYTQYSSHQTQSHNQNADHQGGWNYYGGNNQGWM